MTRDEALQVLGVRPDASRDEVALAYRELAQMLHPDKFGENKRLRARAEQQMRRINEARDVLLKGSRRNAARGGGAARANADQAARGSGPFAAPGQIRFEAEARARAAETARLAVVAQMRTMRERRRTMALMAVVALVAAFFVARSRSAMGLLVGSIASTLVIWGIVDVISLSGQIATLQKRSAELLRQRDAAQRIAQEAAAL